MTPREECYAAIRKCMKDGIAAYYRQHQDRIGDLRSADAIQHSVRGLECILAVLDGYEIAKKED